ncbi:MAG TPA: hypothetical protein VLJ21_03905 [Candidatus Binatia bacterium]|nr:hypothetical protein [Candidatus Binatia bacterium]
MPSRTIEHLTHEGKSHEDIKKILRKAGFRSSEADDALERAQLRKHAFHHATRILLIILLLVVLVGGGTYLAVRPAKACEFDTDCFRHAANGCIPAVYYQRVGTDTIKFTSNSFCTLTKEVINSGEKPAIAAKFVNKKMSCEYNAGGLPYTMLDGASTSGCSGDLVDTLIELGPQTPLNSPTLAVPAEPVECS